MHFQVFLSSIWLISCVMKFVEEIQCFVVPKEILNIEK